MSNIHPKSLFKKFFEEDLIKIFSLTFLSTAVKMITAFISIKVVSKLLGPSGIAVIGQLNNFIAICLIFGSFGITQGVTKYISENKNDKKQVDLYIINAFSITVLASILIGSILILGRNYFAETLLFNLEYRYVFVIFGITMLFFALNNLLVAVVNGFQHYKKYVLINIYNSLVGLVFTISLVIFFKLKGALISLVSYQAVSLLVTLFLIKKENWLKAFKLRITLDLNIVKKYLNFSLMAFTSALTVPLTQMIIRNNAIESVSIVSAGYWEGLNKLSLMYMMLVTSSLAVYYLPRLSELKQESELRNEIFKVYKFVTPLFLIGIIFIFIFKIQIIKLVFSIEFLPMKELFSFQLVGDFLKIISWILAYTLIAKSMTKAYVFTEILIAVLYVISSKYLICKFGIIGITYSYAISYMVYFIILIFIFRNLLLKKKIKSE